MRCEFAWLTEYGSQALLLWGLTLTEEQQWLLCLDAGPTQSETVCKKKLKRVGFHPISATKKVDVDSAMKKLLTASLFIGIGIISVYIDVTARKMLA